MNCFANPYVESDIVENLLRKCKLIFFESDTVENLLRNFNVILLILLK